MRPDRSHPLDPRPDLEADGYIKGIVRATGDGGHHMSDGRFAPKGFAFETYLSPGDLKACQLGQLEILDDVADPPTELPAIVAPGVGGGGGLTPAV